MHSKDHKVIKNNQCNEVCDNVANKPACYFLRIGVRQNFYYFMLISGY